MQDLKASITNSSTCNYHPMLHLACPNVTCTVCGASASAKTHPLEYAQNTGNIVDQDTNRVVNGHLGTLGSATRPAKMCAGAFIPLLTCRAETESPYEHVDGGHMYLLV
eukprot:1026671-Amphidinium_carterae.1